MLIRDSRASGICAASGRRRVERGHATPRDSRHRDPPARAFGPAGFDVLDSGRAGARRAARQRESRGYMRRACRARIPDPDVGCPPDNDAENFEARCCPGFQRLRNHTGTAPIIAYRRVREWSSGAPSGEATSGGVVGTDRGRMADQRRCQPMGLQELSKTAPPGNGLLEEGRSSSPPQPRGFAPQRPGFSEQNAAAEQHAAGLAHEHVVGST